MKLTRREFVKIASSALLATNALGKPGTSVAGPNTDSKRPYSSQAAGMKDLADLALDTAKVRGASYADIRIGRYRNQFISSREERVTNVNDTESFGFGVRTLYKGSWGFASSRKVTKDEIQRLTALSVEIAKANSAILREPVILAPVPAYQDYWQTPIVKDPFKVPIETKIDLLLKINKEALKVKGVKFSSSMMRFQNEWKYFASTEGSYLEQNVFRSYPGYTISAVGHGRFRNRNSDFSGLGKGYEGIEQLPLVEKAPLYAEQAVQYLSAKPIDVTPGNDRRDLILAPSNLALTMHESVAHPTELDRALGDEADFAGTSFATPDKLGKLRYGSPLINIVADRTLPEGLATIGYDDDGVKSQRFHLIKDGLFVGYQTTREQARFINEKASRGCSNAESWFAVPFQRIPNVWLEAGKEKVSLEDLIGDTEDGIYMEGRGSWSIDHQRYNFQFGNGVAWEIKKGKITGMLRDVVYQANTIEFWNSCDRICDQRFWENQGLGGDGKGQPQQINQMSHGCAPARFRKIRVLNTEREL